MQKVNILYLITKLELGGAQKQLLSLITHLDKQRYNLSLIAAQDGLLTTNALSIKELSFIESRFLERSVRPIRDFLALYEIYSFIKKNKIDIVHTHSSKAGILGRWAAWLAWINPALSITKRNCKMKKSGVKIIIHTVHGWSFNEYQNLLWHRIIIWLEKITALITDKLIIVSYHDLQKGLDNRIGNKDKYRLIRYGINYKEFIPLDKDTQQEKTSYLREFSKEDKGLRKELGIDAGDLVVGMVSCFKPQKCPQDFIRLAFLIKKSLHQVHPHTNWTNKLVNPNTKNFGEGVNKRIGVGVKFLLVGDGVLRPKLERLISRFGLGKEVILTGWRQDISRILSTIDVFVLTSLWEGLPISVLEAMATSKPVVVSNTAGITEIVFEGKTGFLAVPGDVEMVAEKLTRLLRDKNLRAQIGENAKNSLGSDFTLESMVTDTENLYWDLIKKKTIGAYAS